MPNISGAEFQSAASAADVVVVLGFVPHFILGHINNRATNPNTLVWWNRDLYTIWQAGADDTILTTGSSGIDTVDTASIAAYAGGDIVTADDVTNTKYRDRHGNTLAAGTRTGAGFSIPAGDQTNSGYNDFLCVVTDVPKL